MACTGRTRLGRDIRSVACVRIGGTSEEGQLVSRRSIGGEALSPPRFGTGGAEGKAPPRPPALGIDDARTAGTLSYTRRTTLWRRHAPSYSVLTLACPRYSARYDRRLRSSLERYASQSYPRPAGMCCLRATRMPATGAVVDQVARIKCERMLAALSVRQVPVGWGSVSR